MAYWGRAHARPPINLALKNRLLAALPAEQRHAVLDSAEYVELEAATWLEQPAHHAYFLTGGSISLLAPPGGADAPEIAVASRHGVFGPCLEKPGDAYPFQGLVSGSGAAWRLRSTLLERMTAQRTALRLMLQHHAQFLLVQAARSSHCLRHHATRQRLARWLLSHTGPGLSPDVVMTHQSMAALLGTGRSKLTELLQDLAGQHVVDIARGHLVVTDREGLEAISCDCYDANASTYRALMGFALHAKVHA